TFLLRQIYPDHGRAIGKPRAGIWSRGDKVHLDLPGTSATVLELMPSTFTSSIIFNAEAAGSDEMPEARAALTRNRLSIEHIGGEYGSSQEIGILLPLATKITSMSVNGR